MTAALAVALTFLVQGLLVLMWRHLLNRRYYRQQRTIAPSILAKAKMPSQRERICCFGLIGPYLLGKPAKFFAFPKSLVWPAPLFFSCCIFVTGLTRSSVYLLAASPPNCGVVCTAVPITVLAVLAILMGITVISLIGFRREHGKFIKWKPAGRHKEPSAVADPYMRARAKVRARYKYTPRGQGPACRASPCERAAAGFDLSVSARPHRILAAALGSLYSGETKVEDGTINGSRPNEDDIESGAARSSRLVRSDHAGAEVAARAPNAPICDVANDAVGCRSRVASPVRPWSATRRGFHSRVTPDVLERPVQVAAQAQSTSASRAAAISARLTLLNMGDVLLTPRTQALLDALDSDGLGVPSPCGRLCPWGKRRALGHPCQHQQGGEGGGEAGGGGEPHVPSTPTTLGRSHRTANKCIRPRSCPSSSIEPPPARARPQSAPALVAKSLQAELHAYADVVGADRADLPALRTATRADSIVGGGCRSPPAAATQFRDQIEAQHPLGGAGGRNPLGPFVAAQRRRSLLDPRPSHAGSYTRTEPGPHECQASKEPGIRRRSRARAINIVIWRGDGASRVSKRLLFAAEDNSGVAPTPGLSACTRAPRQRWPHALTRRRRRASGASRSHPRTTTSRALSRPPHPLRPPHRPLV